MKEKKVKVFCNLDTTLVHSMANLLSNAGIENRVIGDIASSVLVGYNPTQEACIIVFQSDVIRAKQIIKEYKTT